MMIMIMIMFLMIDRGVVTMEIRLILLVLMIVMIMMMIFFDDGVDHHDQFAFCMSICVFIFIHCQY